MAWSPSTPGTLGTTDRASPVSPRTETGATVASLREAQILLKNVGTKGGVEGAYGPATPYRLSDCYVALSPGRSVSLEQLLSLGLQVPIDSRSRPSSVLF